MRLFHDTLLEIGSEINRISLPSCNQQHQTFGPASNVGNTDIVGTNGFSLAFTVSLPEDHHRFRAIPFVLIGFAIYWFCAIILWSWAWCKHRKQRIHIQRNLTVIPVFKVISLCAGFAFWFHCVQFGVGVQCSAVLYILYKISQVFYQVALYSGIFIIAKGCYITRPRLDASEKRSIVWNMFCLGLCLLARLFISAYFVFPLVVMYIVIMGLIFSSISANVRALHMQILDIRDAGMDPTPTPPYQKFLLLRKIQYVISLYISLEILYHLVLDIFVNQLPIKLCLEEATEVILISALAIILRPRDFSRYQDFVLPTPPPRPTATTTNASGDHIEDHGIPADILQRRQQLLTQQQPIYIIENPAGKKMMYKKKKSYSLAVEPGSVISEMIHNNMNMSHSGSADISSPSSRPTSPTWQSLSLRPLSPLPPLSAPGGGGGGVSLQMEGPHPHQHQHQHHRYHHLLHQLRQLLNPALRRQQQQQQQQQEEQMQVNPHPTTTIHRINVIAGNVGGVVTIPRESLDLNTTTVTTGTAVATNNSNNETSSSSSSIHYAINIMSSNVDRSSSSTAQR